MKQYVLEQRVRTVHTHSHQTTSTDTSHRPHDVEKHDISSSSASKTPNRKGHSREEETDTSAEYVRESAVQRLKRRGGYKIRCSEPRCGIGSIELGADDCISRRCDCSIEALEEDIGEESWKQ